MRRALSLSIIFLVLGLQAPAAAQIVRGQLLDGETALPLEGAMMVLTASGGEELSMALTNASGRFILRAPGPGRYTVRADRIGHASTTSDPVELAQGETVEIRMEARVRAIELEGLEISGEARCHVRPQEGQAVATLWEEARKALTAAALTDQEGIYRYRIIRFLRELDKEGRRVLSEQRRTSRGYLQVPFESLPAETLQEEGYVRQDEGGDLYFAPDASVLLSDPFLDTHCLGITGAREGAEGLLGISFEPVGGRELPEIRGVIWVDPASAQLRHLDYTYENLDPALRSEAVGGTVYFQGLPNGTWIVREWRIRMPNATLSSDFRGGRQVVLSGIREVGGEVDQVQNQAGNIILEAQRATLAGVVMDSTGAAPLAGAEIRLLGTGASATTDSEGAFRLAGLSGGTYSVTFSHALVPSLAGLPEPAEVTLTPGEVSSVRMVAPPLSKIVAAACGEEDLPQGSAVLTGLVRDGDTGAPLAGAEVTILWKGARFLASGAGGADLRTLAGVREEGVQGTTDSQGRYLACAVPMDHPLQAEAQAGGHTSGLLPVRVPPDRILHSRDLPILRKGTGSLRGLAVDWVDQGPLEGVRVSIPELGLETLSDEDGRFAFSELPLGRHVLEAGMLGRKRIADTVQIRPDRPLQLELRVPEEVLEVEGITVEVFSTLENEIRTEGFTGARVDRIAPERMDEIRGRVRDVIDVIRTMGSPRIRVVEWGPQGFPLGFCMTWNRRRPSIRHEQTGGGCQSMLIVLDGAVIHSGSGGQDSQLILDMAPEEIESIRVLSPVQAEFRYGIDGKYGALVIETRRGSGTDPSG